MIYDYNSYSHWCMANRVVNKHWMDFNVNLKIEVITKWANTFEDFLEVLKSLGLK